MDSDHDFDSIFTSSEEETELELTYITETKGSKRNQTEEETNLTLRGTLGCTESLVGYNTQTSWISDGILEDIMIISNPVSNLPLIMETQKIIHLSKGDPIPFTLCTSPKDDTGILTSDSLGHQFGITVAGTYRLILDLKVIKMSTTGECRIDVIDSADHHSNHSLVVLYNLGKVHAGTVLILNPKSRIQIIQTKSTEITLEAGAQLQVQKL